MTNLETINHVFLVAPFRGKVHMQSVLQNLTLTLFFLLKKKRAGGQSDMWTHPLSLSSFFYFSSSANVQVVDHLSELMHGLEGLLPGLNFESSPLSLFDADVVWIDTIYVDIIKE